MIGPVHRGYAMSGVLTHARQAYLPDGQRPTFAGVQVTRGPGATDTVIDTYELTESPVGVQQHRRRDGDAECLRRL